jgi:HlyD family secretion protein
MPIKVKWGRIIIALVALGAIALIVAALRPAPVRVEAARVERGSMRVTIDAEGKTRVHDRFVVAAPVTGRMTRITLHRGDEVARGALIARIEPMPLAPLDPRQVAEARARVAAAQAVEREAGSMVERIRADCEQASRERARAERLVESGDISRQEMERARSAETTCRQQLEAARYKSRAAGYEVDAAIYALIALERPGAGRSEAAVEVRSPIAGRVLRVLEESERVIAAGTPLVEMSNPTHLEAVLDELR